MRRKPFLLLSFLLPELELRDDCWRLYQNLSESTRFRFGRVLVTILVFSVIILSMVHLFNPVVISAAQGQPTTQTLIQEPTSWTNTLNISVIENSTSFTNTCGPGCTVVGGNTGITTVNTFTYPNGPTSPNWYMAFLGTVVLLGLLLVGAIIAIRRQKQQTSSINEPSAGSQPAPGAAETTVSKECKACDNINPPYATKYCVKCGSKLE